MMDKVIQLLACKVKSGSVLYRLTIVEGVDKQVFWAESRSIYSAREAFDNTKFFANGNIDKLYKYADGISKHSVKDSEFIWNTEDQFKLDDILTLEKQYSAMRESKIRSLMLEDPEKEPNIDETQFSLSPKMRYKKDKLVIKKLANVKHIETFIDKDGRVAVIKDPII